MSEGFSAAQASVLTGCSSHQLRYWDRMRLVQPSIQPTGGRPGVRRVYAFRDLVELRVVKSLLDNGMSLQRVRRAWDYLRRNADLDGKLATVALVSDGRSIFQITENAELLDALRDGQLAFFEVIDATARTVRDDETRFDLDRSTFLDVLQRVETDIAEERQRRPA